MMQTETQPGVWREVQRTNIALPVDLYERIRKAAFDRRVSQGQVVAEILAAHYAKDESATHLNQ